MWHATCLLWGFLEISPWNSKGKLSRLRLRAVRTCLPQARICQADPGRPSSGNWRAMDRRPLSLVPCFSSPTLSSNHETRGWVTTTEGMASLPSMYLDPMLRPLCFSTILWVATDHSFFFSLSQEHSSPVCPPWGLWLSTVTLGVFCDLG